MKLIDKKGKLFGLINIIDLLVIIVLLGLVVGGSMRFKSKPIVTNQSTKARITYEVSDIRMVSVDSLVEGDSLYHYDRGGYIGKIVDVSYKPHMEAIEGDGEWINAPKPGKYDASIVVEAEVNDNPDVVVVGGEQTRIGAQFRMKNKKIAFFGTVMKMEIGE